MFLLPADGDRLRHVGGCHVVRLRRRSHVPIAVGIRRFGFEQGQIVPRLHLRQARHLHDPQGHVLARLCGHQGPARGTASGQELPGKSFRQWRRRPGYQRNRSVPHDEGCGLHGNQGEGKTRWSLHRRGSDGVGRMEIFMSRLLGFRESQDPGLHRRFAPQRHPRSRSLRQMESRQELVFPGRWTDRGRGILDGNRGSSQGLEGSMNQQKPIDPSPKTADAVRWGTPRSAKSISSKMNHAPQQAAGWFSSPRRGSPGWSPSGSPPCR